MDFARTRGSDWLVALAAVALVAALATPWFTVGGFGITGAEGLGGLGTVVAICAVVLLLLPTGVALATPTVQAAFLRVAFAAAVVALLIAVLRLVVVPDLDLFDFRARRPGEFGPGRTGTTRGWGAVVGVLVGAFAVAATQASLRARRGGPPSPPPPA